METYASAREHFRASVLNESIEIWFGADGTAVPQRMSFLSEVSDGLVPVTLWPYSEVGHNHEANDELKEIGLSGRFQNSKPTRLVERCLEIMCNDGDIVMDCFAGSGTTGHAVLKFWKRTESKLHFILVEMIAEVAATYIRAPSTRNFWISGIDLVEAKVMGAYTYLTRSKDWRDPSQTN